MPKKIYRIYTNADVYDEVTHHTFPGKQLRSFIKDWDNFDPSKDLYALARVEDYEMLGLSHSMSLNSLKMTLKDFKDFKFVDMTDQNLVKENTTQLEDLHLSLANKGSEILKKKNHDYTADISLFDNFEMAAKLSGLSGPAQSCLNLIAVKLLRLRTHITTGTLNNESFEDTIVDVQNYLTILYGILMEIDK